MTDILEIIYRLAFLVVGMCLGAVLISMVDNISFIKEVEKNKKLTKENISLKNTLNNICGINNTHTQKIPDTCKIERITNPSDFKIGNF